MQRKNRVVFADPAAKQYRRDVLPSYDGSKGNRSQQWHLRNASLNNAQIRRYRQRGTPSHQHTLGIRIDVCVRMFPGTKSPAAKKQSGPRHYCPEEFHRSAECKHARVHLQRRAASRTVLRRFRYKTPQDTHFTIGRPRQDSELQSRRMGVGAAGPASFES